MVQGKLGQSIMCCSEIDEAIGHNSEPTKRIAHEQRNINDAGRMDGSSGDTRHDHRIINK